MAVTPMMQQYFDIKDQHKDCILFFRLGDFYEMFFDDAKVASRELEITLTARDCGQEDKAPMCGVPHHSVQNYILKLIEKGYKVAICEQVEDAQLAKGIVKRDVVRIITPGTLIDSSMLDEKKNNYLMAIYKENYCYGIAVVDVSTGEFCATSIYFGNTKNKVIDELAKYFPSEIIINKDLMQDDKFVNDISLRFEAHISILEDEFFEITKAKRIINEQFDEFCISESEVIYSINAAGALLSYLKRTQKVSLEHLKTLGLYKIEEFMILDYSSKRNLELVETMREKKRKGSLLWVVDRTLTSMGARLLRKWIERPLLNNEDINLRLEAVSEMKEKFIQRNELREFLGKIYDIERLMGKLVIGNINCRDLIALKNSIRQLPDIKRIMSESSSVMNNRIYNEIDPMEDIYCLIDSSIIDEPPVTIKEGNIIKTGYNKEVDNFRAASIDGKKWIADLEASEKAKTGIKNLKIGFNKVFGYYLEVTKSNYSLVPEEYIRKQTLANCERFITEELKEMENKILGAEEKVIKLEYEIFTQIRESISEQVLRIKNTSNYVSEIDVICSLAEVAELENYIKPDVDKESIIDIKNGRHPVIEKVIGNENFVPNDTYLDLSNNRLSIITGPNMAGKSTYMRQTALIVLLAQIGSFVPADYAKIGITDRIFTRVGASDDLASGQSTFMVEMSEVSNIINNATNRSILILDEIGRGTSTYDGLSIAWAVIEYICDKKKIGARTLFATHYHELTELEGKIRGIKNYCIEVDKKGDDIIFLRKIARGGADDSYGIQVAKLAGLPENIISRAKEILEELEDNDINRKEKRIRASKKPVEGQLDIFAFDKAIKKSKVDIVDEIRELELNLLTPVQALNYIYELQQRIKKG